MILRQRLPDSFVLNFSNNYFFGEEPVPKGSDLATAITVSLSNGVRLLCMRNGMLAFDFKSSDLGAVERLVFRGGGAVPDEVMTSDNETFAKMRRRLAFAIFVAACIYGKHGGRSHAALSGMRYPNLEDVAWTNIRQNEIAISQGDLDRLRIPGKSDVLRKIRIPDSTVQAGSELADRLLALPLEDADPVQLLDMAYQAMVLHAAQHASASLALSAVVVETASAETLWASGIVKDTTKHLGTAIPSQFLGSKSRSEVRKMNQHSTATTLRDCGVLGTYLFERMEELRLARNKLMHRGHDATQRQSGQGLTTYRDILQLLFSEPEFELNAAFTRRF